MRHFLLVYDRPATKLRSIAEYPTGHEAMQARFAAEREHRGNPAIEVVVLYAESQEALLRTHARYFLSVPELLERMLDTIERQSA